MKKTVAIKFEKRRKGDEPDLRINNEKIRVCESTPYLGLMIDKRLNWRKHIEHLRAKCLPAVNLLRHLSHLSWGADRETLTQLYIALVKSKLDYGAHIYGSNETRALSKLDPIQNACLRACAGAFKSSPAASLCVEAGVPPLKYSRDILALNYFFKSATTPNSPTYQALVGVPEDDPPPKREKIDLLLNQYQVNIPNILSIKTPQTPPWTHSLIKMCDFIKVGKANKPVEGIKAEFLNHLEEHSTIHVYKWINT